MIVKRNENVVKMMANRRNAGVNEPNFPIGKFGKSVFPNEFFS